MSICNMGTFLQYRLTCQSGLWLCMELSVIFFLYLWHYQMCLQIICCIKDCNILSSTTLSLIWLMMGAKAILEPKTALTWNQAFNALKKANKSQTHMFGKTELRLFPYLIRNHQACLQTLFFQIYMVQACCFYVRVQKPQKPWTVLVSP